MSPKELVRAVDFRYITDVITPEEAIKMLEEKFSTRQQREAEMRLKGYPAYTTSAGLVGLFR